MSDADPKSARLTLLLAAGFAIGIAVMVYLTRPPGRTPAWELDASVLKPGGALALEVGKRPVVISVPEGEGDTAGSFTVHSEVVDYNSGPIARDGSLETIWVDDVTGDGREDAVMLVRFGGSGSYVSLFVLEGAAAGYALRALPDLPVAGKPGSMGHDVVTLRDGVIYRSFPSYDDTGAAGIDRQWTVEDGVQGEAPVKRGTDSNADPSGKTVRFRYEYPEDEWVLTVSPDQ